MIDRNKTLELMREAKFNSEDHYAIVDMLLRFADLVAAEVGIAQWHRGYAEGQSVERAACAQIAEMEPCMTHTPHRIAAAIRARGSHEPAPRHD